MEWAVCHCAASARPFVNICAKCFWTNGWIATKLADDSFKFACTQDMLKVKVEVKGHVIQTLLWFHKTRFFSQANGWIVTKLTSLLTSPSLSPFLFLPHPNPIMAVSLRREFCRGLHREAVCQTVCYTVRSHVLSLCAHTLWSTITLTFHTQYQAHTHRHTQPFYGPLGLCPGPSGWAWHQKCKTTKRKPIWIYWSKR